jgi:hypothetical protein
MATQENRSMVSETSICNQALLWLGGNVITSLEEDSREAIWMKNNYPFIRDAVLEERMWTFATVRATSTVADLDAFGAMYVHPKPADWISIFRVYKNVSSQDQNNWQKSVGWRLEERSVLCPDPTIYMWGIKRISDTGAFSPLFTQALAARLAADAAIPLTENRSLQADMWNLYGVKLAEAATRDGQQGSNERVHSDSLVNARAGQGGMW